jgi:GNAT superfamily N-acetyltransferase
MIVREYQPEDFQQVLKVWESTGIYNEERRDTAESIKRCNALGGKFLILEDPENRTIHGTSWMTYDGRRIHLHHFAISTEMQGKGWGRTLAIESLKFAVQVGCPVKLEVHRDNRRALQLYFSLGFREFEDYGVYMFLNPPLSHG